MHSYSLFRYFNKLRALDRTEQSYADCTHYTGPLSVFYDEMKTRGPVFSVTSIALQA